MRSLHSDRVPRFGWRHAETAAKSAIEMRADARVRTQNPSIIGVKIRGAFFHDCDLPCVEIKDHLDRAIIG